MNGDTILLVEDEPQIREMLCIALFKAGFEVWEAESAEEAIQKYGELLPSLYVIDWMLPGMSGFDLVKRLRHKNRNAQVPIIVLTARGEESDQPAGLELGADDSIVKPFSPQALIERIRVLLRHSKVARDSLIVAGSLSMNLVAHQVTVHGEPVKMGPKEFRLLELFMKHPNQAFNRMQLLDQIWGPNACVEERTVDVYVLRLRNALKPFGVHTAIQTVHGVGYQLTL